MRCCIFVLFIFISCKTTNGKLTQDKNSNNSEEQIFIADQRKGLPGKCYQKMILNGNPKWTEVLCESERATRLIKQIQSDLVRLGYTVDKEEIIKSQLGNSTKEAIKQFQQKNKLAFGGLDWATINKLKNQ